jgi:hypothetical protein
LNAVVDTVPYTVTNTGEGDVNLSSVTIEVTPGFSYVDGAGDPACTAADFSINGQAVGTPAVAAPDVTLNGVSDAPANVYSGSFKIQMVENGANQDSCEGQSVPLTVTVVNDNLLSSIAYYVINQGGNPWVRSTLPFTVGVASQSVSSGGVTLSITGHTGYADDGFYLPLGTLGNLSGYTITGTGSQFGTNLYFGYGSATGTDFFTWSGNTYAGFGSTIQGLGPTSVGGIDTVNGSSTFYMVNGSCSGTSPTLTQLKAGTCSGITASTPVAMWVGITPPSDAAMSTTFTSVTSP